MVYNPKTDTAETSLLKALLRRAQDLQNELIFVRCESRMRFCEKTEDALDEAQRIVFKLKEALETAQGWEPMNPPRDLE